VPELWTPLIIGSVAFGVLIYGFSKTAMPVAGMVGSALLAAALGPTIASGFVVPLLIVGDLFALSLYRQHADWKLIRRLVPGVLGGFVLTAVMFIYLPTSVLARTLGVLLLVTAALEAWRIRNEHKLGQLSDTPHTEMTSKVGIAFFGTLTGLTTMAANAGGAALTLYLVKMRVPILTFMGTSTWFFFILNVIKVPFVVALGLLTWDSLLVSVYFLPALVVGTFIGRWAIARMNKRTFVWVGLALSSLGALWLIIHG
jgi:uncharacterized membrane protein YfcA